MPKPSDFSSCELWSLTALQADQVGKHLDFPNQRSTLVHEQLITL